MFKGYISEIIASSAPWPVDVFSLQGETKKFIVDATKADVVDKYGNYYSYSDLRPGFEVEVDGVMDGKNITALVVRVMVIPESYQDVVNESDTFDTDVQ